MKAKKKPQILSLFANIRVAEAYVKPSSRPNYMQSYLDGNATLYYTGAKFPTTILLQDLRFFVPYIPDKKSIRDVYEIVRVRTISAKEAKQTEGEEEVNHLHLAFELRFNRRLYPQYQPINTSKMAGYTFIDTTFDNLDNVVIMDKL